jgi:hypothetical protein
LSVQKQALERATITFEDRVYHWANEQAAKEFEGDYPLLRRIRSSDVLRAMEIVRALRSTRATAYPSFTFGVAAAERQRERMDPLLPRRRIFSRATVFRTTFLAEKKSASAVGTSLRNTSGFNERS